MLICAMAGLVMYARYYDCDPIMTKKVSSADQVCALKRNATTGCDIRWSLVAVLRYTKQKQFAWERAHVALPSRYLNLLQSKHLGLYAVKLLTNFALLVVTSYFYTRQYNCLRVI